MLPMGTQMGELHRRLSGRRILPILLVAAAMLPSAWLAWRWRHMPHLGIYHDDGLYFVTAKAWAEGKGHRIASFPGEPAQTKYPPGLPLVLSLVWRINPRFPDNLPLAMLITWLALPLFLAAAAWYFRDLGFGLWKTALLCTWLAVNPIVAGFSTMLMTELWFGALLAALVVLAERLARQRTRWWWAFGVGAIAAAAALTRSAGTFLLLTVPVGLVWRRQWRRAVTFLAAAAPPLAAWNLWKLMHPAPSGDLVTLYYTDYSAYQLATVGLFNPALVTPYNLNTLLTGLGKLFVFFDVNSLGVVTVGRVLAIGAVVGVVRLASRTGKRQFALFAAVYGAVMLIWHFPPDVRFVTPLAPLLVAGLVEEGRRLVAAIGAGWRSGVATNRAVAAGLTMVLGLGGLWAAGQIWYGLGSFLPAAFRERERALRGNLPAYEWVKRNTPPDAQFFAYDDSVFYLYTGRHACTLATPPDLVYRSDEQGIVRFVHSLPEYANRLGIGYVMITASDYRLSPTDTARKAAERLPQESQRLRLLFATKSAGVYRLLEDVAGPHRSKSEKSRGSRGISSIEQLTINRNRGAPGLQFPGRAGRWPLSGSDSTAGTQV